LASDQNQIGFEQLGLGAVLKRYRVLVPPNQRDYAWTNREVKALLEDLALAISNDEDQHFLGTLVTIPKGLDSLEVVDGQQRLATTALCLAAMYHLTHSDSPNLGRALQNYLVDVDNSTLELSPKMRLNTADTAVFHDLIVNGNADSSRSNGRDSHALLVGAYETAKDHMKTVTRPVRESERVKVFQKWMNYIEFSARAILLKVPNSANAFKMFETLNDRGLRVSQADLVKNYIFGQSGDRSAEAQQIWSYIKGALETLDEDDITINFLRQALISMHGVVRENDVYEKVQSITKGVQSSLDFLGSLEAASSDYVAIVNHESDKWNSYPASTRKSLTVLNLFDIKPFRPVLLSIARRLEPNVAAECFEQLVSYGVRMIIASSTRSGSIEIACGRAAKGIFDGEITTSLGLKHTLTGIIPNDEQFKEAFSTATVSQAKFARYYLRCLELAAKNERDPWLIPNDDADAINLEHVLPQKPMGDWEHFSDDNVKAYSKRLGNMALLKAKANSDLRSVGFVVKREVLKASPYATTAMIGNEANWTIETIVSRQRYLADLALKAWPHRG
jgi:Protein of unknown function DUF262/Protein of unknown function (DUF1524)